MKSSNNNMASLQSRRQVDDDAVSTTSTASIRSLSEERRPIAETVVVNTKPPAVEWLTRIVQNVKQTFDSKPAAAAAASHANVKKNNKGALVRRSRRRRNSLLLFAQPNKKRVHFTNEAPEIITATTTVTNDPSQADDNDQSTWYNVHERRALMEERRLHIEEMTWEDRFAEADPLSWSSHYRQLYQAAASSCSSASKAEALVAQMEKAASSFGSNNKQEEDYLTVLGLEKLVIPSIAQDVVDRRRELYHRVRVAQTSSPSRNAQHQALKIQQASCTVSRPAKAYARGAALLLLGVMDDTKDDQGKR